MLLAPCLPVQYLLSRLPEQVAQLTSTSPSLATLRPTPSCITRISSGLEEYKNILDRWDRHPHPDTATRFGWLMNLLEILTEVFDGLHTLSRVERDLADEEARGNRRGHKVRVGRLNLTVKVVKKVMKHYALKLMPGEDWDA